MNEQMQAMNEEEKIRHLRRKTEEAIADLLTHFQRAAGVRVESVQIELMKQMKEPYPIPIVAIK